MSKMALEQGSKEVTSRVNRKRCFNDDVENSEQISRQSTSTMRNSFSIRVKKMAYLIDESKYHVFESVFLGKTRKNFGKHDQEKVKAEMKWPEQNSPSKPTKIVSLEEKTQQLVSETPLVAQPKLHGNQQQTHTMYSGPEYSDVNEQNAVLNWTKVAVEIAKYENVFKKSSSGVNLPDKSLKTNTLRVPFQTPGQILKKPDLCVYTNKYIQELMGKCFNKVSYVAVKTSPQVRDDIIYHKKPDFCVYTNNYIKKLMGKNVCENVYDDITDNRDGIKIPMMPKMRNQSRSSKQTTLAPQNKGEGKDNSEKMDTEL